MFDPDRNRPIELPLYRISDEIKDELMRALAFWNQYSTSKNTVYVERAAKDIDHPYATTKTILASAAAPTTSTNDNFAAIKINNGIAAFKQYLLDTQTKATSATERKLVADLIDTFYLAIESVK